MLTKKATEKFNRRWRFFNYCLRSQVYTL